MGGRSEMTEEEKKAEHIKAIASACLWQWSEMNRCRAYLVTMVTRHWSHPAFQTYMREMALTDEFEPFRSDRLADEARRETAMVAHGY